MEIRQLNSSHADAYKNIRLESLKQNPEAFGSSFEEEKDRDVKVYEESLSAEGQFAFGAFDDGELAGVVSLVLEQKVKLLHKAFIFAMYVKKEKRGEGIGRKLMQAAIQKAKELPQTEQILLSVVSTNESAKNLYSSLGFKTYGFEKKALKIQDAYYDEEHMVLFL
ncbi:GNAT family N-acetyltransferase [Peribacillus kribbensis]|uniref:GNAT family N-acetyltransferase n=1 Tax=Peribacillus kribbensis TaxID=356658 RepID=UPI00041ACCC9|nr:GNAT family N-acetyltransferase [Peribacillus kribbensis]